MVYGDNYLHFELDHCGNMNSEDTMAYMKDFVPEEILQAKNKPLRYELSGLFKKAYSLKGQKDNFKLDDSLTQIILPNNKLDLIINWWNETIRFEKTIPHAFESGYIILDYFLNNKNVELDRKVYKELAKICNTSVYDIKYKFKDFLDIALNLYLYFKFLDEDKLIFIVYRREDNCFYKCWKGKLQFGTESQVEYPLLDATAKNAIMDMLDGKNKFVDDEIGYYFIAVLSTVLWYIATNTSKTKYIYTEIKPKYNHDIKKIIDPKDVKTITTTIYDLSKVKTVNIDTLNRRKAGWTYSHSFEVHGHYRHYKNGKVIFINPYVKGKEKPIKSQKIILNPKEEKNV